MKDNDGDMKILVDVLGGDNAPKAVIEGAISALNKKKDLELALVGPKKEIEEAFNKAKIDPSRYEVIESNEAVLNTDHPSLFIKEKPSCSMALAFEELRKRDDLGGFVSAGPTGALLTGAILRIGRIQGVARPCLMATIPTRTEKLCRVLDAGANMDCKPEYLYQFAVMADTYLKVLGEEKPRIATLSVGQEEGKGNEVSKAAYELLKASELNFVGNIEGDHVLKGEADIVVCDGFSGNVFLKSLEEACYYISDKFKAAIFKNIFTKLAALTMIKGLKNVKKPFEYANKASAPLLGCKKLVLKCHGKAKPEAFEAGILEAALLAEKGLLKQIEDNLKI